MALRASGYVFWLTSGDKTTRFFPDVDMGMMERIFGMKELQTGATTSPRGSGPQRTLSFIERIELYQ